MAKDKHAARLGRKGGKARKAKLTPERLAAIGRHAATVRWTKARRK